MKAVTNALGAGATHDLESFDALVRDHEQHGHHGDEIALPDGFRATDVGNASRLIKSAGGRIRFVHAWGKWIVFLLGRWVVDVGDALVTEAAKQVARDLFLSAVNLPRDERNRVHTFAQRCEQASSIGNMLRLARGVPGVLVDHSQLDAHPELFNVLNGTFDLMAGELKSHDPNDLLTMQAPVAFDADALAPTFDECIATWQPDPELRRLLQQAVGTGITGHPVERLFINVGTGANGKSKFYGALSDVLGPFAVTPHKSLLVASKHEGHPTHVASLFRARMIIAPETSQQDHLDEEMVKNLTGGDTLAARRMREDEWRFAPTHSTFIHTNHRPRIKGTDEGIWRRVVLIPWEVTIPIAERDEMLADKLRAERSGILNWAIAGALDWMRSGLVIPSTVLTATAEYRNSEDQVGRFINDMCVLDSAATATARALRVSYEAWCEESSERPFTAKTFGQSLAARGLDSAQVGADRARTWIGIGLR